MYVSFRTEISNRLLKYEPNGKESGLNEFATLNMSVFHSVLAESFNISSWNGSYEFGEADFLIGVKEISTILESEVWWRENLFPKLISSEKKKISP